MALRYIDSMGDHYTDAQATEKWTAATIPARVAGAHGYGMTGYFLKGILFGSNTIIVEMQVNRLRTGGERLATLYDSTSRTQCYIYYNSDGSISFWRDGPGTSLIYTTAPDLIRQYVWAHVGWRVLVHPTAGSMEVRVNGGTVGLVTGVKTTSDLGSFSGLVRSFSVGTAAGPFHILDDVVVMDDVDDGIDDPRLPGGGGYDKFIGPVVIRVKRPNTTGFSADWTPTPGTNPNWDNVNDIDPDDDTTTNLASAAAIGASDLFGMEDLAAGEDVLAAQTVILARKTNDGSAAVARLIRDGGTTNQGPTVYQPTTYGYMHNPEPTLPDGSLWNVTRWNAIQCGYKRVV